MLGQIVKVERGPRWQRSSQFNFKSAELLGLGEKTVTIEGNKIEQLARSRQGDDEQRPDPHLAETRKAREQRAEVEQWPGPPEEAGPTHIFFIPEMTPSRAA